MQYGVIHLYALSFNIKYSYYDLNIQIYSKGLHVNEVARHIDALYYLCRALKIEMPNSRLNGIADFTDADVDELDAGAEPIPILLHDYLRDSEYSKKLLGTCFVL